MRRAIIASLSAAFVLAAAHTATAATSCTPHHPCKTIHSNVKGFVAASSTARHLTSKRTYVAHRKAAYRQFAASSATKQRVVSMIKSMAPSYGVPTWFALRIAKVESGYNPLARGRAGEYGVFQLKCATARLVGFRGNCHGLLNASTNVQYGLRHLAMAVRSSHGNLRLAASKHNGGLGRRRLVRAYVNRVF